jgi:glutathione synthase/RimK-type ligase-like ATP-grasp enzyme
MYSIKAEQFERFPKQMMELAKMAEELGYEVKWVDKWSGGLLEINGRYFGYGLIPKFPLNSGISRQLAKDKVYAYMLMENNGIRVPEGDYFFRFDETYLKQTQGKGIAEAKDFAQKLGYPVFVKPNRGALGRDCKLVINEEELGIGLEKIWTSDFMAIIQRVLFGREYRVMFLDGEVILVYEKSKLYVEGDGVTNLKFHPPIRRTNLKQNAKMQESRNKKQDEKRILKKGERYYLTDVANLSGGGVVVGVVNEYSDELKNLVRKISEIFGLRYGGIDFIGGDINYVDELTVLEVNADPGLEGFIDYDREKGVEVLRKLLGASLG